MTRVRVGIIGTSWYADFVHLPNMTNCPDTEVVAVCGRRRERSEEMAEKYSVPNVFNDYRDLLAHPLDAVVIATPDDTHYDMTMAALDAGLHVLCEKPLALNATQVKEMYDKAEAAGLKHMVFFSYRFLPHHRHLKRLIEEDYLGRIYHCTIRYMGGFGRDGAYGWRFDAKRSNGNLGDMGSHAIDLAHWFVGDIAKISCQLNNFVMRPGTKGETLEPANDAAVLAVEFANGALGTIQVSAVSHLAERRQEQYVLLCGEKGTLELTFPRSGIELRGARSDDETFQGLEIPADLLGEVDQTQPFFQRLLEYFATGNHRFIEAILQDKRPTPSFLEGLKAQEVIDAAIAFYEK